MARIAHLYEVCLRDGLQNEPVQVPTDVKVRVAEELVAAGVQDIEVTSFVSPRWVPQLQDAADVLARLPKAPGVRFWALVPNRVGLDRAMSAGVQHIATFLSASETHNSKNVNRTVGESLDGLTKVIDSAALDGLGVRSYVSCAFGCPYEGVIDTERVVELAIALRDAGAQTIALGDTTGMGHPDQVVRLLDAMAASGFSSAQLALHFHDTRGLALANVMAAWKWGIRHFDGSVAGVGGCPYAPGAAGNVASEDVVHALERIGGVLQEPTKGKGPITGVDLEGLSQVGGTLAKALGRELPGRYHRYELGRRTAAALTA